MNHHALLGTLLLFIGLGISSCKSNQTVQKTPQPIEFVILQLNDVYEIDAVEGGKRGGLARVAWVRKQLMEKNPNVITILSGDFLSPSLTGSLRWKGEKIAGQQMIETLNAMGLDYVTFGNHEFDLKYPDLQRMIDLSQFTWTSSNVLHTKEKGHLPFTQRGEVIPEHVFHNLKTLDGQELKIGFIGNTLPFNKRKYVHYEDKFEEFRKEYQEIKGDCDMVIGITHMFADQDDSLAKSLPDIPLFLGGHDHINMKLDHGSNITAKADANAKTVYVHWVTFDPATKKTSIWSQLYPITPEIPEDPGTRKIVDKWMGITNASISGMGYDAYETIGTAKKPLDGKEKSVRSKQTNLGNLIGLAMLKADPKAQAGFLNGGSIRLDDEIQGTITQYDILRTLPFGGSIVHGKIPGDKLKMILETGTEKNRGEGGYLQLTGFEKKASGWYIDGTLIADGQWYDVVLPKFLSEGREANLEFMGQEWYSELTLTGAEGEQKNDIRDVVITYLRQGGEVPE